MGGSTVIKWILYL